MCRLLWRDVDVRHQRFVIWEAKTDTGNQYVDLCPPRGHGGIDGLPLVTFGSATRAPAIGLM
jgi:hypothetical protein